MTFWLGARAEPDQPAVSESAFVRMCGREAGSATWLQICRHIQAHIAPQPCHGGSKDRGHLGVSSQMRGTKPSRQLQKREAVWLNGWLCTGLPD